MGKNQDSVASAQAGAELWAATAECNHGDCQLPFEQNSQSRFNRRGNLELEAWGRGDEDSGKDEIFVSADLPSAEDCASES